VKFRFEDQPHQGAAIAAITDLFEGALRTPASVRLGRAPGASGHAGFTLDLDPLTDNLKAVTQREGVAVQDSLKMLTVQDLRDQERNFPNFSVEMETGTGKTYVYIATALRLAELYGLRKFVILVHSVAIRAGVMKTFEQTEEHFRAKFPALPYRCGVLGEDPALNNFIDPSSSVQFLIASVQSIDKPDSAVVYQSPEQPQLWRDTTSGIAGIADARPVVIVDEPQNFVTPLRTRALATLNPLVALRYSATHKEPYNLVHRLGPKAAMEAGLVKRVSVKGVVAGGTGEPYLLVKKVRSVNRRLMAETVIQVAGRSGIDRREVVLQNGTDLYEESEGIDAYRGMTVERIDRKPDRVVFQGGREVCVGVEIGVDQGAVWSDQIRHTIRAHLARQDQIDATGHDVKVLSLFFVERVADYVEVPNNPRPTLPELFDRIYRQEWVRAGKPEDQCSDPSELRVHYFPSTKTGIYKDTRGNVTDAEYELRAYEQIVAHKEQILTRDSPWAFIFSHSALREGWDNPNVFQIGFLRHSRSETERRQQVGRGLRIPVDTDGSRVMDATVNRLTLVVDESFREFRDGLNQEYAEARGMAGDGEAVDVSNADDEIIVRRRQDKFDSAEFDALWGRIQYKAHYRVRVDASVLPSAVAQSEHLRDVQYLFRRSNIVESADLEYDEEGKINTGNQVVVQEHGTDLSVIGLRLPDIIALVEDQLLATKFPLQLTRPTIAAILRDLPRSVSRHAIDDPDRWARVVAHAIRVTTIEEMVKHISYEPVHESDWWNAEVVFLEAEEVGVPVAEGGKDPSYGVVEAREDAGNLFSHTIYDSHIERNFSGLLENYRDRVKLFTKLPRRFKVRTPVGEYSPDWAILYEADGSQRLYLVRETKDTLNLDHLEWDEAMRIRFAERHFEAAPNGPVDYLHTTDRDGLRIQARREEATEPASPLQPPKGGV
jgi:type III restriction enzyme